MGFHVSLGECRTSREATFRMNTLENVVSLVLTCPDGRRHNSVQIGYYIVVRSFSACVSRGSGGLSNWVNNPYISLQSI